MSIFGAAADLVGDIGLGVIKHSGRVILGGGQTLLGVITEDEELIGDGIGKIGKGALGLGSCVLRNAVLGDDSDDDDQMTDLFDE